MDFLKSIFLNLEHSTLTFLLIKLLFFILVCGFFIWLIHLSIAKSFGKAKMQRDFFLKLGLLWTLPTFLIIFSIYFFLLIRFVGLHHFRWTTGDFYLGILPQLLVFVLVIILFVVNYTSYNRLLGNRH